MKIKFTFCFFALVAGLMFPAASCAVAQQNETKNFSADKEDLPKNVDSPQTKNASPPESFTVGKQNFHLTEKDGKCLLSYEKNRKTVELILKIAPTCNVVRDNKNKVRSFNYKDIKSEVFMVVGGVKDMSGKLCGSEAQVILLKKDSASPGKTQKGVVCVLFGTDEKNFWLLSH